VESDCYCTRSEKGLGVLFRNELGLRERKKERKKREGGGSIWIRNENESKPNFYLFDFRVYFYHLCRRRRTARTLVLSQVVNDAWCTLFCEAPTMDGKGHFVRTQAVALLRRQSQGQSRRVAYRVPPITVQTFKGKFVADNENK
jgi:hypothetical protein